jgi:hypothetical protein
LAEFSSSAKLALKVDRRLLDGRSGNPGFALIGSIASSRFSPLIPMEFFAGPFALFEMSHE